MAEVAKVLYIVVVDDEEKNGKGKVSFRYTRPVLQSTLQLMGCKARHAFKISKRVFEVMRAERLIDASSPPAMEMSGSDASKGCINNAGNCRASPLEIGYRVDSEEDDGSNKVPFESYKRRTTVVIRRETFLDAVCNVLAEYKYVGPNHRADLVLACRIRERKESVTVLLCGTSGCGKSTLSALLGSRLGITTVISTDSIRHMMRSFVDEKQNPLLWASTYHAGDYLDPVAVAEAKAKRKAKKLARISHSLSRDEALNSPATGKSNFRPSEVGSSNVELISPKQMAIEGFKAQSEMVIDSLDRLITAWEERKESVVVEGVHLSLNFVMGLMKKHPSIIPFMVYITNEEKHLERFAVRAKCMALDPAKNKYVRYIRNIRTIQDYLCNRADKHLVPKINNTNVDKSVAAIHATVFSCLRRREEGEQLYDPTVNMVGVINDEYRNHCTANSLTSKGMFQLIQRKDSSGKLMALLNTDGSVAKAWPVDSRDGTETGVSTMYGSLMVSKAEPVNIQFGLFGITAWPSEAGGSSHSSSLDESRADGTENGSRYYSSCCSSPRISEGHSKELKEEQSVGGSDEEEVDDLPEMDSDEDLGDSVNKQIHEVEGSVDEESTKSDEEYDDLAMQDEQENGNLFDNGDESKDRVTLESDSSLQVNKYKQHLVSLFRTRSQPGQESPGFCSRFPRRNEKKMGRSDHVWMRKRSLSIPALGKYGSLCNETGSGCITHLANNI